MEENDFIPIEDVVGPSIHYNVDPHDLEIIVPKKVVVISEPSGLFAIEEAKAKIIKN